MELREYIKSRDLDLSKEDLIFELCLVVRDARMRAGMTQAELAKKMGTTQSGISEAESGKFTPTLPYLKRVAEATGGELILPKIIFT